MKKATVEMPMSKFEIILELAKQKGGPKYPYSGIINDAIDQFIEQKRNPDHLVKQMERTLKSRPDLFAPVIAAEVQRQLRIELHKIYPDKY